MDLELPVQQQVDYLHYAQKRASADTYALTTSATLALVPGTQTYALPDDLVVLRGLLNGTTPLDALSEGEMLAVLSGFGLRGPQAYGRVGRTLYIFPIPGEAMTLTLVYVKRASDYAYGVELELQDEARQLTERLAVGQFELDRGEIEVGAEELTRYEADAKRLRAQNNMAGWSIGSRLAVKGVDPV